MNIPTQNIYIIELLKNGWVSPADAFREVGTMKLATRVSEIRRLGINVESRTVSNINRYGQKIHYNEYRIKEKLGWLSPVQYRLNLLAA